ncbi:unnamed protein product [Natator depressus]
MLSPPANPCRPGAPAAGAGSAPRGALGSRGQVWTRCGGPGPGAGAAPPAAAAGGRRPAGARSRQHSRRVLDTVVSEPGPGMPWFSRVVYVDDQVIYVYTSGTQRVEPGPVWMAQYEGPEFWDERTWWGQRYQKWYNASLNTLSQLYNQSEGSVELCPSLTDIFCSQPNSGSSADRLSHPVKPSNMGPIETQMEDPIHLLERMCPGSWRLFPAGTC